MLFKTCLICVTFSSVSLIHSQANVRRTSWSMTSSQGFIMLVMANPLLGTVKRFSKSRGFNAVKPNDIEARTTDPSSSLATSAFSSATRAALSSSLAGSSRAAARSDRCR
jgi:hypothetical protein